MNDFKLTISSLGCLVTELTKLLKSGDKTYRVSVKEWRESRSLSQNALYWKWLNEINNKRPLVVNGSSIKGVDLWHEVFKKFYCPAKNVTNGDRELQVKSTKILDVGEMTFYLSKIELYCINCGIALTIPESSDYYKLVKGQDE